MGKIGNMLIVLISSSRLSTLKYISDWSSFRSIPSSTCLGGSLSSSLRNFQWSRPSAFGKWYSPTRTGKPSSMLFQLHSSYQLGNKLMLAPLWKFCSISRALAIILVLKMSSWKPENIASAIKIGGKVLQKRVTSLKSKCRRRRVRINGIMAFSSSFHDLHIYTIFARAECSSDESRNIVMKWSFRKQLP